MEITVEKTTPILEPMSQLNIGATFKAVAPPDGPAPLVISAPAIRSPAPRSGRSTTSTRRSPASRHRGQVLALVPDAEGVVHAYNADTGAEAPGRATTASDTMPASSATWPVASSTSPYRRAGAAGWPTSSSRSMASPSRACRRIPAL